MPSPQFNFRVSKALLYDLEFVASRYGVEKTDWLRVKLAELIEEEKTRLVEKTESEYLRGLLNDEGFQKRMGFPPPKELQERRQDKEERRQALRRTGERYLRLQIARLAATLPNANTAFDRYMQQVMEEVEKEKHHSA